MKKTMDFKQLYYQCPEPVILIDSREKVDNWNDSAKKKFGWTEYQVKGKTLPIIPPEYKKEFKKAISSLKQGRVKNLNLKVQNAAKEMFDVEVSLSIVNDLAAKKIICIIKDVTDYKNIVNELQQECLLENRILEMIDNIVVVLDRNGRILLFNESARKATGYKDYEVLNKNIFDILIPENEKKQVKEVFKKTQYSEENTSFVNNWKTKKKGNIIRIKWLNSTLKGWKEGSFYIIGIGVKQSSAENVLSRKDINYVNNLNNSLAAISGEIQWIQETEIKNKKMRNSIDFINSAVNKMINEIKQAVKEYEN